MDINALHGEASSLNRAKEQGLNYQEKELLKEVLNDIRNYPNKVPTNL